MNDLYGYFVECTIMCIQRVLSDTEYSVSVFCEGGKTDCKRCSEYACLYDEQAELFVWLLRERAEQIGLHRELFQLRRSRMTLRSRVPSLWYPHSCYPKNIRRWIKGTVSRKKKCRAEFTALVACWAAGWCKELRQESAYCEIRNELKNRFFAEETTPIQDIRALFDLLWNVSEQAYWDALQQKKPC